jgi:hypothetical protein
MSIFEQIQILYPDTPFLTIKGMDEAIIGYEWNNHKLIYSQAIIIKVLCRDMCEEDALAHFYYEFADTNDDDCSPIICMDTYSHYDLEEIKKMRSERS